MALGVYMHHFLLFTSFYIPVNSSYWCLLIAIYVYSIMLTYHFSSSFWIIRHSGSFQVSALIYDVVLTIFAQGVSPLLKVPWWCILPTAGKAGTGGLITFMISWYMTRQTAQTLQGICNSSFHNIFSKVSMQLSSKSCQCWVLSHLSHFPI